MEQKADTMERESPVLHALRKDNQTEILGHFSAEQQQEILHRQQILSSLAYFIGKDFQIPVELNQPGAGWHWDFGQNKIRVDPQDLVEKPMDYLRFVISHEGGHRRVSRTDDIPPEVWRQPGFSFMMNAIEDPRTNNFVAEAYPRFGDQMDVAYQEDLDFEGKAKGKAQEDLGYTPRFMQAGFEYIRQWYKETQGDASATLSEDLPDEVRAVVEQTVNSARDSWLRYPSKAEADASEEVIRQYANVSYEINRDEVWPEFKKLVEADMEDQKLQEMMKEMQGGEGGEGQQGLPQELNDQLSEAEQQELEEALQNGQVSNQEGNGKPRVIDLDSLSEGLKQKMKDYIDSLPEDVKRELAEKAQQALQNFEREVNEEFEGKLSDNPDKKAERGETPKGKKTDSQSELEDQHERPSEQTPDQKRFRDLIEKTLRGDENVYEEYRRDVLPLIDALETDLREIFVARRTQKWQSGFKTGKRIDIKKRMQEKALGISAVESRAWQKRELPSEKDYAISLLVDLSGSMQGQKIRETFKAAVVLAEVLNRLSINTEILGFNDRLYEYQPFGQDMSREVREHMGGILQEVNTPAARYNDDGWAVAQASERLAGQKAAEKFLFVLSDGLPEESGAHPKSQYELGKIVARIMQDTDQKLIGLGIGPGTDHVERYYPNSVANIGVREMSTKLADVIREAIANYDTF
ncbi:VWA domain-containing protein [Candidatus Gottesmanbacteria bacterium]|nr:VWA domain-containing protein [Candidatus Gottesmanbacteria bacterium]